MCGIAGKVNHSSIPVDDDLIRRMCADLVHRGPDDEGYFLDGPVALGMRRLSIIDVAGGHQPICNEDGSIWLVINGEIYNFQTLRRDLESRGHRFSTSTDIEVVLHLYEEHGMEFVARLNGMFAFALWDMRHRLLILGRDRMGKKPLYYAMTGDGLVFASEIQPILEDRQVERSVDQVALQQYLKLWYIPGPRTIFERISRLPAAHLLVYQDRRIVLKRYWDVDFTRKLSQSDAEWEEQILALLEESVRMRMVSDVPLGALLSGGIDSSSVVALMSRFSSQPVKTFSIGFEDQAYDELPYARLIADRLGTEHHEEIVRPDAAEVLPKLVRHYGEPFGDESCIPTYYVSRLAHQHVKVALGGDGGDENFGGYPRLTQFAAFKPLNSVKGLLREFLKNPSQASVAYPGTGGSRLRIFFEELEFRLDEIFNPMQRYANQWLVWKQAESEVLTREVTSNVTRQEVFEPLRKAWKKTAGWDALDRLLYLEMMTYLPDDLQKKIDTASMACSLEVRAPFLDYRLVELAAKMPSSLKFKDGQTKSTLRKAVKDLLPAEIAARSKWGFSMPVSDWLRKELRPMTEGYLLDTSFQNQAYFSLQKVRWLVEQHLSGDRDYGRHIWLILNFQIWYRAFIASQ